MFSITAIITFICHVRLMLCSEAGVQDRKELDYSIEFAVVMPPASAGAQGLSTLWNRSTTMMKVHGLPASFGPSLPYEGISGNLTHPVDRNECDNFRPGDILLTWYGSCTDREQIQEAMEKGIRILVLITDTLENAESISLPGVQVPAVFLLELDGVLLWDVWSGHSGRYVHVRLDTSVYDARIRETIIFFSSLSVFLVVYFSLLHIKKYRRKMRAERNYKELIKVLPERTVPSTPVGETDCAVCQEDFSRGDTLRMLLPCKHEFHSACIDSWLKRDQPDCPKCRQVVKLPDPSGSSIYGAI